MIFSLPKLMALAGVIWAVWMGFKYLERRKGGDEGADSGGDQAEKGIARSTLKSAASAVHGSQERPATARPAPIATARPNLLAEWGFKSLHCQPDCG